MDTNLNQFLDRLENLERTIELGYIPKDVAFKVDKFARATLANNITSLLASFNNLNPFLDTPTELYLASDDVSDTFNVSISYIDQNRDIKEVIIPLNGTTPVIIGSDVYCVYRMFNANAADQVGSRVVITSNATGIPVDDSEVYCDMVLTFNNTIPANQSLTSIFSVPRNYTGFITRAFITADKGSDVKGVLFTRKEGKVFRFTKALEVFEQTASEDFIFQKAEEKTDLKPLALAQTGGITYTEYTIVCIHNDYLNKHIG